jgi:hypothetical protein
MILERMYIEELKKELPWCDIRSIKKFLRTYHIQRFYFEGTKIWFVLRDEFERQMEKIYNSKPVDKNSKKFSSRKNLKRNMRTGNNYKPLGEHETTFLSTLQNFIL